MVKPKKTQEALRRIHMISGYRDFMKSKREVKHGKRKIRRIKEEGDMGCQPGAHTGGDREVTEAGGEGTVQRRGQAESQWQLPSRLHPTVSQMGSFKSILK